MKTTAMEMITRNAPCWCGSGKKYKKCHLNIEPEPAQSSTQEPVRHERKTIIKTEEQIAGIRKSSQLTKNLLDMVEERIKEGLTTNQIDQWVYDETIAQGAIPAPLNYGRGKGRRGKPFPKSVCTSLNEVVCHGIPNDEALKNGDIINVDVTCELDGYFGDASRMFIIGEVSDEVSKLVLVAKECLDIGIDKVKPGNALGDIGHAIQKHAEDHGFSVVRDFAGHGVGLSFHEAPQILHYGTPGQGEIIVENMTFTIEPMINLGRYESKVLPDGWTAVTKDGSLSAQWEHTLLVTANGVEILTG